MQVIAFCYQNALFSTTQEIIINKRKHSCAFDTHVKGHLCYNV